METRIANAAFAAVALAAFLFATSAACAADSVRGTANPDISEVPTTQADFQELGGEFQDRLPDPPAGMEWKLVWHDEFNGNQIDWSRWEAPDFQRRDGFWSHKTLSLDGKGALVMVVVKDPEGNYLDGCLRTKGKYEKAKGFFVTRVKFHKSQGHWAAFWLMNGCQGRIGNGSADGAEIDIMEKPWLDDKYNVAIHWDGYGEKHGSVAMAPKLEGAMEGYHTFGLWWSDDAYRFYADGRQTWATTAAGICTEPLYIKLTDEIGDWAGDIRKAKLPDQMMVDYVRVYDLVPQNSK